MSTIYFTLFILFFLSAISARRSPRIIYSAIIYNQQNSPIQCNIIWLKSGGATLQSDLFTIEKDKNYTVNENIFDMGTWQGRAIIDKIQCGNLILPAPFKGVHRPSVNWKFVVTSDEIVSVGPNSILSRDN